MSEHSIEELMRQRDRAKSKLDQADAEFRAANKRLRQEISEQTGLLGTRMVSRKGKTFIVSSFGFLGDRPFVINGLLVKSNGEVGVAKVVEYFDTAKEAVHDTALVHAREDDE